MLSEIGCVSIIEEGNYGNPDLQHHIFRQEGNVQQRFFIFVYKAGSTTSIIESGRGPAVDSFLYFLLSYVLL
jgi:hypothetical protein